MSVTARNYGDFNGFRRFWAAKNKAKQSQFGYFTAENAELAESKEIQSIYYFSALFAISAVNKKNKANLRERKK